jgi:hypothetical protein
LVKVVGVDDPSFRVIVKLQDALLPTTGFGERLGTTAEFVPPPVTVTLVDPEDPANVVFPA